jgi:hypothetical protein
LPEDVLSFLLFPVAQPQFFDAVLLASDVSTDSLQPTSYSPRTDAVLAIKVKAANPGTHWIWGAFKMPGTVFHDLRSLWISRNRADEYIGTLINAYLAEGGAARGFKLGHSYVDVGTLQGYRSAMGLLNNVNDIPVLHEQPTAPHACNTLTVEDRSR